MMDAGEFKREDFTFQTKIVACKKEDFMKRWEETWNHVGDRLGYIDLFAFHVTSSQQKFDFIFGEEKLMDVGKMEQYFFRFCFRIHYNFFTNNRLMMLYNHNS